MTIYSIKRTYVLNTNVRSKKGVDKLRILVLYSGKSWRFTENPTLEKPILEKPTQVKPILENPTQLNTNNINTLNKINTNPINSIHSSVILVPINRMNIC